jgi:hypothetical protein
MSVPIELPTGDRTIINTEDQISFVNSPIHLRLQNAAGNTAIVSVAVYIWIWNGSQNKTLGKPNHVLEKDKVSILDDYIQLEVADLIKSFLQNPSNGANTFQPNFYYNEVEPPVITGQGVFWQIVTDITDSAGTVRNNYLTNFATLGYRWNYEQNSGLGNNGTTPNGSLGFTGTVNKWYNPLIHNYITQAFNLTNAINVATAANMITQTPVVPSAEWSRCARDPSLIVFLNKLGLWEMFTPHGKFTASATMKAETSNRSYRDPSRVDNAYAHSKQRGAVDVSQSYVINTGSLTEDMAATIEELVYSPKVYLIRFKGDIRTTEEIGITVDSTLITVDDTNITVDSATVGAEDIGFFKTHQQIPVTITDSDFLRKSRVNDKNEINYNVMLGETNNKINNIR